MAYPDKARPVLDAGYVDWATVVNLYVYTVVLGLGRKHAELEAILTGVGDVDGAFGLAFVISELLGTGGPSRSHRQKCNAC
jgi:hypothetical protein